MQWNRNSVRDPVCGMYLDPSTAITRNVQGRIFYFCAGECAQEFLEQTRLTGKSELNEGSSRLESGRKMSSIAKKVQSQGDGEGRQA